MSKSQFTHKQRYKNNFLKTREIETIPVREPILIVCEDSKSSVYYLREKRDVLRLEATKVRISGESGSHPSSVVEFSRIERDKNREECRKNKQVPYKLVYCVFDVDEHPNLAAAIQRARDLGFIPIVSNQAFELWYLLHYLNAPPGWMSRSELNTRLSSFMKKSYQKGMKGIYNLINAKEENAIKISEQLLKDAEELSNERDPYRNPSTEVHLLIKKLNELNLPQLK